MAGDCRMQGCLEGEPMGTEEASLLGSIRVRGELGEGLGIRPLSEHGVTV